MEYNYGNKMDSGVYYCPRTKIVVGPVIGSDLVPLKRATAGHEKLTSFDKKRERRRRHLKEFLRKHAQSEEEWGGMLAELFELATNSADLVDKSLIELCRQVIGWINAWKLST